MCPLVFFLLFVTSHYQCTSEEDQPCRSLAGAIRSYPQCRLYGYDCDEVECFNPFLHARLALRQCNDPLEVYLKVRPDWEQKILVSSEEIRRGVEGSPEHPFFGNIFHRLNATYSRNISHLNFEV